MDKAAKVYVVGRSGLRLGAQASGQGGRCPCQRSLSGRVHPRQSVLGLLLSRFWDTGTPRLEILYLDGMAEACVFLVNLPDEQYKSPLGSDQAKTGRFEPPLVNIGTGTDVTIRELAEAIVNLVGYEGKILFDPSKPDGTPRRLMNIERLNSLGWFAATEMQKGLSGAYSDFRRRLDN